MTGFSPCGSMLSHFVITRRLSAAEGSGFRLLSRSYRRHKPTWFADTPLPRRLDEGDLIDLFHRRQPSLYSIKRRLAEEMHSFLFGSAPDFAAWLLGENHLAHIVG